MGDSEETALDAVNERNTKEYIPAIVVITAVIATGLCLNAFSSVYYGLKTRKSVFQIFVASLSINFVITNLVLIYDIVELFYFVSFKGVAVCKLFYVLKHWLVGNSLFFMVAIGFDRYRTVCFPFSKPLTFRKAWCIVFGLATFSFVIAARLFATTDIVPVNITLNQNTTIQGRFCSFSESENLQTVRVIFHYVDISIHSFIIFSFVFFYTFVIRKLIVTRRKLNTGVDTKDKLHMDVFRVKPSEHSEITSDVPTKSTEISSGHSEEHSDTVTESSPIPERSGNILPNGNKKNDTGKTDTIDKGTIGKAGKETTTNTLRRKKHARNKARLERRISVMATVKTLGSIVCFTPFYISMVVISPKLDGDGLVLGVGSILARRSYMLNSVVNPIIMIIFNDTFRHFMKDLLYNAFSKFQKKYRVFN